jgi:hypothetical protein
LFQSPLHNRTAAGCFNGVHRPRSAHNCSFKLKRYNTCRRGDPTFGEIHECQLAATTIASLPPQLFRRIGQQRIDAQVRHGEGKQNTSPFPSRFGASTSSHPHRHER